MADMNNVEGVHRLTPTQAGMLYEILSSEDPSLYFEQVRAQISSPVDVDRYQAAWQQVLNRHEALRTIIVWEGLDEPVQVVRRSVDVDFNFLDWSDRDHTDTDTNTDTDTDTKLDQLANLQRKAGINLTKAPLASVYLIKLDSQHSHLIWNFHHIIADGWSAAIVMDDVLAAYDATLPEGAAPQFSEYIDWVLRQDRVSGMAYWQDLLGGVEAPTRFAVTSGTAAATRYLARKTEVFLEPELTERLQSRARQLRVTTNTFLQGACAIAFAAFSNETDITFGVTTGGRPGDLAGIETAVGMYLKTLPCRIDVSDSTTAGKWLTQLQEQQLSADEHAHIGLAEAIASTDLAGAQSPFDLVWIYENFPKSDSARTLQLEVGSVFEQTNYPMTVMAGPKNDQLSVSALFNGNLLSDEVVESFLQHFTNAAWALVDDTNVQISDISAVDSAEQARLIALGAGPKSPLCESDLVHRLFDAKAKQTPDAVALIGEKGQLTYEQVRTHSNWLAERLISKGVGPGKTVGVEMRRSPANVIALLSVAKTGAAYVPLDPSHPDSRRDSIKHDAETHVVLTEAELAELGHLDNAPAVEVSPLEPLLITFTSGSTGAPKGVPVHHRGVINRLQWQWNTFGADAAEVMAHKTSFTFVDHLFEVWGGLLAGRTIVVVGEEVAGSPHGLVEVLNRHKVTQISLVPSLLSVLCENEDLARELQTVKLWTVSGEPISAHLAQQFYDLRPDATLLNFYGMSEASQDSTWYQIPNPVGATVPIGQAIANLSTYVVGPKGQLSPDGVVGELCLAGEGLSLGYLNRPDLTAEKFIPNPFGEGLVYKTGDLVRRRSDGNLEIAGRLDRQVKVRGVRVEPDGVETALRALPSVDQAAVVCIDATLVAFVVGADADAHTIRSQMAESVPDAMVPTSVHVITDIPRTASGKLDRQLLLSMPRPVADGTIDEDRSNWSAELAAMVDLWQELLGTPVGPDDDFFTIGGHSLLGLRLFSRIKRDLGHSLSLSQLATASTPRALLSAAVAASESIWTHLVPMAPEGGPNLFCLHGAGGNILNLRDLANELAPLRRLVAVKAAGADDDVSLPETMDDLLEPYVNEIDQFQPSGVLAIAGFSNGGLAAYEVARRLIKRGRTVSGVILLDTFHPSAQPQAYGLSRHLEDLKTDPVGTLKFKANEYAGKAKIMAADRFEWAESRWDAESTEANLMRNNIQIWAGYTPERLKTKVSLMSASETHPNWLHLGTSRQWPAELGLEVVLVPGDHTTHVEGENAISTAAAIHAQLEI